jgi:hypothetical protein
MLTGILRIVSPVFFERVVISGPGFELVIRASILTLFRSGKIDSFVFDLLYHRV